MPRRERLPRRPQFCSLTSRDNARSLLGDWPIPASSLTGKVEIGWIEHCRFFQTAKVRNGAPALLQYDQARPFAIP